MRASIIVPVYNAQDTIIPCLNSLTNQSLDSEDYEIICVNDGSLDNSLALLESYESFIPLLIINQVNSGPAAARNHGAGKARGKILVFTDSDCELHYNWLEEMLGPFELDKDVVGVQGCYNTRQINLIALYEQFEIDYSYNKMQNKGNIDSIGTYSAAYKKDIFIKYNGFNTQYKEASGEDFELSYKIHNDGYKMILNKKAVCFHKHSESLLDYLRTKFKRGYWRILLYKNVSNKIFSDTYSSNVMKIQFILVTLLFFLVPLIFINKSYATMSIILLFAFFILCIPVIKNSAKSNIIIAVISPMVIFFRSVFFLSGMIFGLIHLISGKIK